MSESQSFSSFYCCLCLLFRGLLFYSIAGQNSKLSVVIITPIMKPGGHTNYSS